MVPPEWIEHSTSPLPRVRTGSARSNCDRWEFQPSVVSLPRNQRYLQPLPLAAGVVACQRQDARKGPGQLDLEPAVDRQQADLVDQAADGGGSFVAQLGPIELLMQAGDLLAIDLGEIGVKANP